MAAASTEALAGRAVAGEAAEISASLGRVFNEVGNEAAGGARAAASEAGGGGSGGSVIEGEVAGGGDASVEGAKGNQLINGKWVDAEGLPLPVPPSVGASGRVPNVLQTGGNTLNKSTANGLNTLVRA